MTAPLIVKIDIKFGHSLPHRLQWHRYCCLCAAVWQIYVQPIQDLVFSFLNLSWMFFPITHFIHHVIVYLKVYVDCFNSEAHDY